MADELRASDIIRTAIAHALAQLVAHETGVCDGRDPEAVHRSRVATRRLRSDLKTFAAFVDDDWSAEMRGELRWYGAELGAVRDLEVMRDRLRKGAAELPPSEADAARRVIRRLDADREVARRELVAAAQHDRYQKLRSALAGAVVKLPETKRARRAADKALAPAIRRRWKQLAQAVDDLGEEPKAEALHAVRIRAKRCRYAAEACTLAFGARARRFATGMTDVQDVLGEHRDALIAGAWLAKTAHECSPTEAYAVGMLAEKERCAAVAARAEFPAVWKRASAKKLRTWL